MKLVLIAGQGADNSDFIKAVNEAGSELAAERAAKNPDVDFSYSLQSLWPVNKQNAPNTEAEKTGLKYIAENKGENYYTTEKLGGKTCFTAVYPDIGVAPVCVSFHNAHPDTPKSDFKLGDVMGGVVIRIPVDSQCAHRPHAGIPGCGHMLDNQLKGEKSC